MNHGNNINYTLYYRGIYVGIRDRCTYFYVWRYYVQGRAGNTEKGGVMIRTQKEWKILALEHGPSGDMVFDILDDWQEQISNITKLVEDTIAAIAVECHNMKEAGTL